MNISNSKIINVKISLRTEDTFNIFLGKKFLLRICLTDHVIETSKILYHEHLNLSKKNKSYVLLCMILRSWGLMPVTHFLKNDLNKLLSK